MDKLTLVTQLKGVFVKLQTANDWHVSGKVREGQDAITLESEARATLQCIIQSLESGESWNIAAAVLTPAELAEAKRRRDMDNQA